MDGVAFALLVLGVLVGLGGPPGPLTPALLPLSALHGVVVLGQLADQRRRRLRALAGER